MSADLYIPLCAIYTLMCLPAYKHMHTDTNIAIAIAHRQLIKKKVMEYIEYKKIRNIKIVKFLLVFFFLITRYMYLTIASLSKE